MYSMNISYAGFMTFVPKVSEFGLRLWLRLFGVQNTNKRWYSLLLFTRLYNYLQFLLQDKKPGKQRTHFSDSAVISPIGVALQM